MGKSSLVVFGAAARAFALGSQLVVLLVMSWMLPKSEFGDAMIVFTLYRLMSLGLGTGLGNLLLFHVGRNSGDHALDIRLLRTLNLVGATVSIVVAAGCVAFASQIAGFMSKPGLVMWLVNMSPMVVFGTLNFISAGSFDGRSRITESIVVTEVAPNGLRVVGLLAVALLSLPSSAIAHVLWLAVAMPWLWDARRLFDRKVEGLANLTAWDIRYAAWFTVYPMAGQQLQGIDMLIVGTLFSSVIAAEYSIASRLASFYPFFQYILIRGFSPRAGALIKNNDIVTLNNDLVSLKYSSIIYVCGLVGFVLIVSPIALRFFGDYAEALPIMVALALPAVVRSVFAGVDAVLKMSGYAGVSSLVALGAAATIVLGSLTLTPFIGIYSLPISMLCSALVFSPVMTAVVGRLGVVIIRSKDLWWLVAPSAALLLSVLISSEWMSAGFAGGCLLATAAAAWWILRRHSASLGSLQPLSGKVE